MGKAVVSAACEDFTNRIGGQVRSMSRAGRMATYEWRAIADEFLDYLGALSVETPDLDTAEAKAALKDASEAAAGAVAYAAYHPHCSFQVFLEYVNFGMSYDPGEDAPAESVTPGVWVDALCLAVLRDKAKWHGEAFHFARQKFAEQAKGTPAGELATALTAVVLDDTGDDEEYPPSAQAKLTAVDAALDRIRIRAETGGEPLLDRPDSAALRTLRALAAEDRQAFDAALADLLVGHAALHGPTASPSSLLPLVPIALAALAYRTLGWAPVVHTGYLPHALVTGFETRGPRVAGFGRNRRPDAVAALAAGPLVVERPACERAVHPQTETTYEKNLRKALTPVDGKPLAVSRLGWVMDDQERLFKWRAGDPGDVTDAQLTILRLASQMGAALFRIAMADPGTEVEVTIDGRQLRYRAERGEEAGAHNWQKATAFALITGAREDLAPLVLTGPTFARPDGSAFAAYREALHAYLKGTDPEPAVQRSLQQNEKAKDWGFAMPPAVLLSQLVEGDEESFNLALADALESHRAYYQVADRADASDASVNLDILALACHARRRGWAIRVESPYLPQRLLQTAEPF
ncbi:immunity 49 family protein [Streptomyces lavenduligriseus]|uniref:Immunity 49 family protein n=1 Tax=Streptomyces lavenduligriseus TaxID=67315 RepID=A0ABT0P6L0_9ACTN|nr:immunity 49 family protein [Streptomyces lavenduligriseus]MCL3999076.1 immunity 49 family protein [Streptomyces lavenduligriseus]